MDMLEAATARRDAFMSNCTTLDQARDVAQAGVARVPWELVGPSGEERPRGEWPHGAMPAAQRRGAARHR